MYDQKTKISPSQEPNEQLQLIYSTQNYFSNFYGFPSMISYFRKSTKMWLSENPPKMTQLHKYKKSSEMVVRGWYMAQIDRTGLLKSKKIGLGWYCNYSDSSVLILRNFSIFFLNFVLSRKSSKNDFSNFRLRNFSSKMSFTKNLNF